MVMEAFSNLDESMILCVREKARHEHRRNEKREYPSTQPGRKGTILCVPSLLPDMLSVESEEKEKKK